MKELEFLEQSKDIIDQINSLSNDSEKISNIVTYSPYARLVPKPGGQAA